MTHHPLRQTLKQAFTLIELLVVISIVGVLLAIMLPSLQQARVVAQSTVCQANNRSIGQLVMYYADDYKDYVPCSTESTIDGNPDLPILWYTKLCYYYLDVRTPVVPPDYLFGNGRGPERLFICPTTPDVGRNGLSPGLQIGYGWNYLALSHLDFTVNPINRNTAKREWIQQPSNTIMAGDSVTRDFGAYAIQPYHFSWWTDSSYPPGYRHLAKANFVFADGHSAGFNSDDSYQSDTLWRMRR